MTTYIADGVYLETDGYEIILTTQNGYGVTNRIVLEPFMLDLIVGLVVKEQGKAKEMETAE